MIQVVGLCIAITCSILLALSVGDKINKSQDVSGVGTLTSTAVATSTMTSSVAQ